MDQPVNPSDIIGRYGGGEFTGGPSRYAWGVGQVNVRPAASNDIPPLLALVRHYWEFEGIAGFTALRIELVLQRLLAEPRLGAIWVAESDARLVGYLIAVLVLSVEHQGLMGEIDEFFVGPEARASCIGAIWVAESDARLVGYLIAVLVLSVEHQGLMGEIDEFFVVPEARASGIGTQLLAAAEAALAVRGCVRLQLQLGVANSAARAFYQHRGYTARAGYELLDKPLGANA